MRTIKKKTTGYKEENIKDILKLQEIEFVPQYDSENDEYVVNLKHVNNICGLIPNGWNASDKNLVINTGDKLIVFPDYGLTVKGMQSRINSNTNYVILTQPNTGIAFVTIGNIIIITAAHDI